MKPEPLPKEEIPVSNCCAWPMPDWPDNDLCPRCKEHAAPEEEEENYDWPDR